MSGSAPDRPRNSRFGNSPHGNSPHGNSRRGTGLPGGARSGVVRPGDDEPGPWGRPWGWWREVALMLPPPPRRGRRADTDLASVIAAILYQRSEGCPWRRLPDRFPPWQTVYSYHRRWLKDGTLRKIRDAAQTADQSRGDRPPAHEG